MSTVRTFAVLLLATLTGATAAFACGNIYYPNSYLTFGKELRVLAMPEANFRHELSRIFEMGLTDPKVDENCLKAAPIWRTTTWDSTMGADRTDLHSALDERGVEPAKESFLEGQYQALRSRTGRIVWKLDLDQRLQSGLNSAPQTQSEPPKEDKELNMLDFFSDALVLQGVPTEFAIYCRGAIAYHKSDMETAVREWKALLELPAEERRYRSTWAAHMLAKALLKTDPASSVTYFAQVRDLSIAGFHDSLDLAKDSFGWQAQAEMYAGEHASAIQHYAQLLQSADEGDRGLWCESLRAACQSACQAKEFDPKLADDPLCRRLIAAWLISHPDQAGRGKPWNDMLRKSGLKGPYPDADRLAWASYNAGDVEMAEHWIEAADPASPYAKWVKSKLLLREGRVDEAIKLIHTIIDAFPEDEAWYNSEWSSNNVGDDVKAELGVLVLGRGEYTKALDLFLRADYWTDAAYVAERVLTLSELRAYVDKYMDDPELSVRINSYASGLRSRMDSLQSLLQRRLVRAGQWTTATKYGPSAGEDILPSLTAELRAAAEKRPVRWGNFLYELPAKSPGDKNSRAAELEWARHVIAAARIARESGMELMGTETEPDWYYIEGCDETDGPTYHRTYKPDINPELRYMGNVGMDESFKRMNPSTAKALSASDDETRRVWKSAPNPVKRFHYRYVAADLMWQVAEALPDNDPLMLYALYQGGAWIKDRDPQAADRFYKAMVRRCPNLPYAQEADELHWFPKTPPPEPVRE